MVVESVSAVANANNTDTLTVNAPTGVVLGDLLVATTGVYTGDGVSDPTSFDTPVGWIEVENNRFDNEMVAAIFYKIADASDVLATDFDFTTDNAVSGTDQIIGQIIRASGQNTLNPLADSSTYGDISADSSSFSATHPSFTPATNGVLVVVNIFGRWISGGTGRSVSNQNLVSGAVLTEGIDIGSTDGGGGNVVSSAYGIQATAQEITGYTADFNVATNDHFGQIAIFTPPVDATGTNTLAATTSVTFAQTGTCDTNSSNVLTEATAEVFAQAGRGEAPTQWNNKAKGIDDWVNKQK
jgi:hypothetical protein